MQREFIYPWNSGDVVLNSGGKCYSTRLFGQKTEIMNYIMENIMKLQVYLYQRPFSSYSPTSVVSAITFEIVEAGA